MKRDPNDPQAPASGAPSSWRSLEHRRGADAVLGGIGDEFKNGPAPEGEAMAMQRRDVLKLAGASMALAGLGTACFRRPEEEILPYAKQPEEIIPGIANYYATVQPRSEGAIGLVVESHEGRPTKIEGNALHPASLGAADAWAQAEVLKLYDPDRKGAPHKDGKAVTWADWDTFAKAASEALAGKAGQGLAFLVEDAESPTFDRVMAAALGRMPNAKVYRWDPLAPDRASQGADIAFGPGARVHHDLGGVRVMLALDSDFLCEGPDHVRLARQFGKNRRPVEGEGDKAEVALPSNRLYAVEGVFSRTGATADHRLPLASGQGSAFLAALAAELVGKHGVALGEAAVQGAPPAGSEKWIAALAKDLAANRGKALVFVGERQPAAVHALAHAINVSLGAAESGALKVSVAAGAAPRVSHADSLAALTKELQAGAVDTLVIFDANPVYTAPGANAFAEAMKKAKVVVHAGVVLDETGAAAGWHVPLAHFLESWGDARAWDGTASIVQPLILPLHGARASLSVLAQLTGNGETNDKKLVAETWSSLGDKPWRKALHDGVIPDTARAAGAAAVQGAQVVAAFAAVKPSAPSKDALELAVLRGHLQDGRLANVSWCQELPDSMTKMCWDNAVIMAPSLAAELGVTAGPERNGYGTDVVEVSANGAAIKAPAFVFPGFDKGTVALAWGYGKRAGGEIAKGAGLDSSTFHQPDPNVPVGHGVDPAPLLSTDTLLVSGVKLTRTGTRAQLCTTQDHFTVPSDPFHELTLVDAAKAQGEGRKLGQANRAHYRGTTAAELGKNPEIVRKGDIPENLIAIKPKGSTAPGKPLQPVSDIVYDGQQWGMVIDLSACIGCDACVVACQAENNIPAVGRIEVLMGREMHWMRIDRYFVGDVDQPQAAHQPVNCMQCELAPCESVCPVSATVHDEEGLNAMAYNRCIGTRYCSNNCPYKVRRFNYLDFTTTGNIYRNQLMADRTKTLALQRNPNVTVRYRGTMEKCTYCTQRIEEAKIAAKRHGDDRKKLPDGAATPACEQTCPTNAIVFGNINDPTSRVARLKLSERNYEMLQELNARPRTTFLARIRNTNEELG
ncbi:MAG: hypothetical protein A2138_07815 [Deltaproteobacteria bacterium RBG_16_71_12]|nr:MAG: hypothetical protein A2138_07815 [Deltaproteobacteria bacterium RBG_16_71_12]